MAGIFINYRRDDAPGVAGRLYDHLARNFPKRNLFMDVDAMKPGFDFVKQLDAQVSQCDALLAVIGPKWLEARDGKGLRRLDSDAGLCAHRDRSGPEARHTGDTDPGRRRGDAGRAGASR
ncbi:MAG: TIR domain-containing protein [Hyphomicrobium sp.]